jgi:hypothetical protein
MSGRSPPFGVLPQPITFAVRNRRSVAQVFEQKPCRPRLRRLAALAPRNQGDCTTKFWASVQGIFLL